MTHRCLPTIIQGLHRCYLQIFFHRMWHSPKFCLRNIIYLSPSTNNQLPCGYFFVSSVFISPEIGCLVAIFATFIAIALEKLALFCFLSSEFSARTFYSNNFFFLFFFCLNLFFRTKGFISWGNCMPYVKC